MAPVMRSALVGLLGLAVLPGCDNPTADPGTEGPVVAVRDSAGVEIVESRGTPAEGEARWRISEEPLLTIGAVDGDPAEQFSNPLGARRLTNGNIVVFDSQVGDLRFFDSEGQHIVTRGGGGEGPGEFGREVGGFIPFHVLPGDTVLLDAFHRHLWFGPDGEYLREARVDIAALMDAGPWGTPCLDQLLPDRTYLKCVPEPGLTILVQGEGARADPDIDRDFARLVRVSGVVGSAAGPPFRHDTLGLMGGTEERGVRRLWNSRDWVWSGGDPTRIYLARNPDYSIEVWSLDGQLERIIRRVDGRRAPTNAEVETALADYRPSFGRTETEPPGVPDSLPAVEALFVGHGGDVWVRRYPGPSSPTDPGVHDAFDSSGAFVGSLTLPAMWIYDIGEDYILWARFDENDVPFLELHELMRGEG